ncbi:MAG: protein kinase [Deltaproteobacteria bacterium]|nr:protein kinase [Deltaproteobacteria bacterium]
MRESIGRYKLDSIVGRGAMGLVYKAKDPDIDRFVAIKVLNLNSKSIKFTRDAALDAFKKEAKAAGALNHPNIVTVYEVNFESNPPYIVMQYIEGVSVSKLIVQNKLRDIQEVVFILTQVADALDYAHKHNVFHRDIKPSNLLYTQDRKAYILDFGVAAVGSLGSSKYIVGTIGYMSPEQMMNLRIGPQSDQFSFAVTAYELISGQRPFKGQEIKDVLREVSELGPESLPEIKKNFPAGLQSVFLKAFSYEPESRFQNCSALVNAITAELNSSRVYVFSEKTESNLNIAKILEEERKALLRELGLEEVVEKTGIKKSILYSSVLVLAILCGIGLWLGLKLLFVSPSPVFPTPYVDLDLYMKTADEVVRSIADPNLRAEDIIVAIKEGVLRNPANLLEALTVASVHPNKEVRLAVLDALEVLKNPQSVDLLIYKLTDPDPEVRLKTIHVLRNFKEKRIVGYLNHIWLTDIDPRVKLESKKLLDEIKSEF